MTVKRTLMGLAAAAVTATLAVPVLAAVRLNAAGATFPAPIYAKWIDAYGKATGTMINYQAIGSGGGIQQMKARTVDFGASDAPLSNAELASMPAPIVQFPTVGGAVALSYNLPGVRSGMRLTPGVLADIYLGKIRRWNDPALVRLNPSLRNQGRAIAVAHRSDGSGTTFIFTSYLSRVSREWKAKVGLGKSVNWPVGLGGQGNPGVAGIIKQTPGGIGYVELAYVVQNHLTAAAMQNPAGRFVMPTLPSTVAAIAGGAAGLKRDIRTQPVDSPSPAAYPIAGVTYLLAYKNMPDRVKAEAAAHYFWWATHQGQSMAAQLLYARLPPVVVKLDEAIIRSLRSGGRPLLAAR